MNFINKIIIYVSVDILGVIGLFLLHRQNVILDLKARLKKYKTMNNLCKYSLFIIINIFALLNK
jgi:hypothetical protein